MELGTVVYFNQSPWTVLKIHEDGISVKDDNGMVWANAAIEKFSLEPKPESPPISVSTSRKAPNHPARRAIWENPEKRQEVLRRLISNPSAYVAAAWLLKNNAHFHLSITP